MYSKKYFQQSFTLIEMLIVIVIIGILAAALVPRLTDMQARARDTKRKVDLKNIHDAVMVYFADNGQYPLHTNQYTNTYAFVCPTGSGYNNICYIGSAGHANPGTQWFPTLSSYMSPMPIDPINQNTEFAYGRAFRTGYYNYYYGNVYNSPVHSFDLGARLENRQDPDRCGLKLYKMWSTNAAACPGNATSFGFFDSIMIYDYSPPYATN